MELIPGIHQFSFLFDRKYPTNVYVLCGPDGSIMVDTGLNQPGVFEHLLAQFEADGIRPEDISDIILTHFHADHVGLAAKFKELSCARLLMHPIESQVRLDRYSYEESHSTSRDEGLLSMSGVPEPLLQALASTLVKTWSWVDRVPRADVEIGDNAVISNGSFDLSVIFTPGHSPGHIGLYEPASKLLFSGDHVCRGPTYAGIDILDSGNPVGDFLGSLGKLRDFDISSVLPGHGKPFTSLATEIDRQFSFHEERQRHILSTCCQTPVTAFDIACCLDWTNEYARKDFLDLPNATKRRGIMEVEGEMEFLCISGKVVRIQEDGRRLYVRPPSTAGDCPLGSDEP